MDDATATLPSLLSTPSSAHFSFSLKRQIQLSNEEEKKANDFEDST